MMSAMTCACQLSGGTVLKKSLYNGELNSTLVAVGLIAGIGATWSRLPTRTALPELYGPTRAEMGFDVTTVTLPVDERFVEGIQFWSLLRTRSYVIFIARAVLSQ